MSLSIQAPISESPMFSRFAGWVSAHMARRRARRIEATAVEQLRQLDLHLQRDLDLDREALWQPRPEFSRLQTPYLVATFSRDDDQRLLV